MPSPRSLTRGSILVENFLHHSDCASPAIAPEILGCLIDFADDRAIIATDLNCRVTWVSSGASRLLGWPTEELVGRFLPPRLVGGEDEVPVADATRFPGGLRADPDETGVGQAWTASTKDGRSLRLRVDVQRLINDHGDVVGYFGIAVDVSEQVHLRAALRSAIGREQDALARVAELDRTRQDFVDTAGHELRTPLTSITGFLEVLEDSAAELGPEYELILTAMRRNCDRLVTLADDLTTLAAFDAGAAPTDHCAVNLNAVLHAAEAVLREKVTRRSLRMRFTIPAAPIWVTGDAPQLQRLVLNLLYNSVKFTDGPGTIGCRLSLRGDSAVVEVTDDGVGVPASEHPIIFERFYRGANARQRHIQGPGLGLTLAHSIVTAHQGKISVESRPQRGSTFTVTLPLRPFPETSRELSDSTPGHQPD